MGTEDIQLTSLQYNMIYYTVLIGSSLSIISSLPVIFFFHKFRKEIFLAKFLFHQAIADVFFAISILMTFNERNGYICIISGIMGDWSMNSSIMWATNIAIYMYYRTVQNSTKIETNYFKICFWTYLLTFLVAVIRIANNYYPKNEYICGGINPPGHYTTLQDYIGHYLFLFIAIIVILFCYIKTVRFLSDEVGIDDTGLLKYPLIFCFTWGSAALANYLNNFVKFVFAIQYTRILLTRSLGFINAILYGIQILKIYRDRKRSLSISEEPLDQNSHENEESQKRERKASNDQNKMLRASLDLDV